MSVDFDTLFPAPNQPHPNVLAQPDIEVEDEEFLRAVFRENWEFAHVTGFPDSPDSIANDRRSRCWGGTWYRNANGELQGDGINRYFAVSIFNADPETGRPVRRKRNFLGMYCLVIDDVMDKIPREQAERLPSPSWRLETSPGNEQWGFILQVPETNRLRAENLTDGLIRNGLAPDGKDPGMRGVTRYVRLPNGWNTKSKYGNPYKNRMLEWNPEHRVSIEEIAGVFAVDLNAKRKGDSSEDGIDHEDHPIVDMMEVIEVKGGGEYGVICPWIDEHSNPSDTSGAWLITHEDGGIGYTCHHGHCEGRHGPELLKKLGMKEQLDTWKVFKAFDKMGGIPSAAPTVSTTTPLATGVPVANGGDGVDHTALPPPVQAAHPWDSVIAALPLDPSADMAALRSVIRMISQLPSLERGVATQSLRARCKGFVDRKGLDAEFRDAERTLRVERVAAQGEANEVSSENFAQLCREWCYVGTIDQFIKPSNLMFLSEKAFRNMYCHIESEIVEFSESTGQPIRSEITRAVLTGGMPKVDAIDYYPGMNRYYTENGVTYLNLWNGAINRGAPGDVQAWLNHFNVLGIREREREHMLDWMAFTLQHPDRKINHILMLGGEEGIGKDYLLYPMVKALNEHSTTIQGSELASDFNEFLLRCKHLHVNELEAGTKREKTTLSAHLKPLAAAPPDRININRKGISVVPVRNIVNITAATNDRVPLNLGRGSRRYFMVWSDASIRDRYDQVTPQWQSYWNQCWTWMRDQGAWQHCVNWLMQRDVSGFDPGAAPHVTEHQHSVVEASRSGLAQYLIEKMESRSGSFSGDLVTSEMIFQEIKDGGDDVLMEFEMKSLPGKKYIGRTMVEELGLKRDETTYRLMIDGVKKPRKLNYFVLENWQKYLGMSGKDIFLEIEKIKEKIPDELNPNRVVEYLD